MTTLPLYQYNLPPKTTRPQGANAGLWFNKFFVWPDECLLWSGHSNSTSRPQQQGTRAERDNSAPASATKNPYSEAWLKNLVDRRIGDLELLNEAVERRKKLILSLGGKPIFLESTSRFVTGLGYPHPLENGLAWHQTLGVPYIPGSGLKGLARNWAILLKESGEDDALIKRIFGPTGDTTQHQVGAITFLEALPISPVQLVVEVMTPHYGPYYQSDAAPGDYHNPVPIKFLAVEARTQFITGLVAAAPGASTDMSKIQNDLDLAGQWLMDALADLGVGAKTATGFGRFEPDKDEMKRWEAWVEGERQKSAPPLERKIRELSGMTERQLYEAAQRTFGQSNVANAQELDILRQALMSTEAFACWKKGAPKNPKDAPAGGKKLKEMARLVESGW